MNSDKQGNIIVSHINVRQSISILLAKIVTLDLIAASCIIVFFTTLCGFNPNNTFTEKILSYNVLFFVILGFLKIFYTVYVVLLWLNEYYEIKHDEVLHKQGLIWRKEQQYAFKYVRTIKLNQGLLGKIFNFGSISLFDIRKNKFLDLYLIHDPHRYMRILEHALKGPHEEKRIIKVHLFGEDAEIDEGEDYQQIEEV